MFGLCAAAVGIFIIQTDFKKMVSDTRNSRDRIPHMDVNELVQTGNKLFQDYRYDDAQVYYLGALRKNTSDPLVYYRVGLIYEMQEEYFNAESAYRHVIKMKPDSIEALYHLTKVYQITEKHEKALAIVEQMLNVKPDHEDGLRMKAQILLDLGRYSDAITVFQHLLKKLPDDEDLLQHLADTFFRLERWNESMELYQQLLSKDLHDRRNNKRRVYDVYFIQGKFDEAIAILDDILATGTGSMTKEEVWRLLEKCYIYKAIVAIRSFQHDKARDFYEKALTYNPDSVEVFKGLGKLYADQAHYENAMSSYQKAQQLAPYDLQIPMSMGLVYEQTDQYDEAIRCFIEAGAMMPSPQIHYSLGTLYGQKGDLNKCVDHLLKAIRMNPSDADSHYNLGVAYEKQRNWRDARKAYKRVLTIDKDHVPAKCNLAFINQKNR